MVAKLASIYVLVYKAVIDNISGHIKRLEFVYNLSGGAADRERCSILASKSRRLFDSFSIKVHPFESNQRNTGMMILKIL